MSNKLTYIEARDKIWSAYFRDEIKPMQSEFCFCGTLCPYGAKWNLETIWIGDGNVSVYKNPHPYSLMEYKKMEMALFTGMSKISQYGAETKADDEFFEDALLSGMIDALEVLKSIHKQRGDFIPEDEPLLTKRNLEHA